MLTDPGEKCTQCDHRVPMPRGGSGAKPTPPQRAGDAIFEDAPGSRIIGRPERPPGVVPQQLYVFERFRGGARGSESSGESSGEFGGGRPR
jgi:hypothetical protein